MLEIARTLGVSKSSVSLWVRDIEVEIRRGAPVERRPNALQRAKLAEIADCDRIARDRIGALTDQAFLAAGAALYAGEGAKRDGSVVFANTDPAMIAFFCAWLRRYFSVDEGRLRARVYLHEGLDLDRAQQFWSAITGVPLEQFRTGYTAKADPSRRLSKHEYGCAYVIYSCSRTHRLIMGLVRALLSSSNPFRGSSIGGAAAC
jgi:hypothetical protein